MKLFSGKKKEDLFSSIKSNKDSPSVPSSLPSTAIDELENTQVQKHQTTQEIETTNQDQNKENTQIDNQRKISSDILLDTSKKSRMPVSETRYVEKSNNDNINKYNSDNIIDNNKTSNIDNIYNNQKNNPQKQSDSQAKEQNTANTPDSKNVSSSNIIKPHFFIQLEKMFMHKDNKINDFKSKDLVNKMKGFHESLKTGQRFFLHEDDITKQVNDKVTELKNLESEWIVRKKEAEAAEMFLLEKEIQIETKLEEMKNLVTSADKYRLFYTPCSKESAFKFSNGHVLNSIQELLYYLPNMSNEMFEEHVSSSKNDFSEWVQNVFSSKELADMIKQANSRLELIKVLKSF